MARTAPYKFAKASGLKKIRAALKAAGVTEADFLRKSGRESLATLPADSVHGVIVKIQAGNYN